MGNIFHFCLLWFSGWKSPLNYRFVCCSPSTVNQVFGLEIAGSSHTVRSALRMDFGSDVFDGLTPDALNWLRPPLFFEDRNNKTGGNIPYVCSTSFCGCSSFNTPFSASILGGKELGAPGLALEQPGLQMITYGFATSPHQG